jgi:carbonic anhydrase/acetyltransferase-like protein (isoleucine patch superfamily)
MAIAGYGHSLSVGDYCSIAHRATLHGCKIGDNVLIGIGATILDRCEIRDNSIVAAHSLLREGTIIPPNSLVVGTPSVVRLTRDASVENRRNALLYHRNALAYTQGDHRDGSIWRRRTGVPVEAAGRSARRWRRIEMILQLVVRLFPIAWDAGPA